MGTGQTSNGEDISKAWSRCQMMLQEWQQKRWMVYHLVTFSIVSTGAISYTFGPGGQINTNSASAWGLTGLAPLPGLGGFNYALGDTVTLAPNPASGTPRTGPQLVQVTAVGAGGAVVSVQPSVAATGWLQFASNPIDGDTVALGGVVWTLVAAVTGPNQTEIQTTADLTVAQLATDLAASGNAVLAQASYGVSGSLATTSLRLNVLFGATGTIGDSFTLAASSATPSGPTLSGGSTNATTWPGPLPNSWTQATTTGAGSNLTLGYPAWVKATSIQTPRGSQRPPKLESAFLRQIQIASPNQVDYPLEILQAHEDYDRIALKSLQSFPNSVFLDSDFPLGNVFCYPVPQASIYSINLTVMQQLQVQFATLSTPFNLPFEYYSAVMYNLALRLRNTFQIPAPVGDVLPGLANNAMNTVRGPNTQIARLKMPTQVRVGGNKYNIFSDRNY